MNLFQHSKFTFFISSAMGIMGKRHIRAGSFTQGVFCLVKKIRHIYIYRRKTVTDSCLNTYHACQGHGREVSFGAEVVRKRWDLVEPWKETFQ